MSASLSVVVVFSFPAPGGNIASVFYLSFFFDLFPAWTVGRLVFIVVCSLLSTSLFHSFVSQPTEPVVKLGTRLTFYFCY